MAYALFVINPLQQIIDDVSKTHNVSILDTNSPYLPFQQLSIHDSTFLYNLFKKPPIEVFIAITVFNITNAEAFLDGSATQLNVTEVGPFVYR